MMLGSVRPLSESTSRSRKSDSGASVGNLSHYRHMPDYANQKLKEVVRGGEEGAERGEDGDDGGRTIDRKKIELHRKDLIG